MLAVLARNHAKGQEELTNNFVSVCLRLIPRRFLALPTGSSFLMYMLKNYPTCNKYWSQLSFQNVYNTAQNSSYRFGPVIIFLKNVFFWTSATPGRDERTSGSTQDKEVVLRENLFRESSERSRGWRDREDSSKFGHLNCLFGFCFWFHFLTKALHELECWPMSGVQTKRSEACTHDQGQDSLIQID